MWQVSYCLLLVIGQALLSQQPGHLSERCSKTITALCTASSPTKWTTFVTQAGSITRNIWTYFRNHIHQTNLLFGHHRPDCLKTCAIQVFFVFSMFHKSKKYIYIFIIYSKQFLKCSLQGIFNFQNLIAVSQSHNSQILWREGRWEKKGFLFLIIFFLWLLSNSCLLPMTLLVNQHYCKIGEEAALIPLTAVQIY